MTTLPRLTRRLIALVALFAAPLSPAVAQSDFEPLLVVNDRPITGFELEQRALLLEAFGAGAEPIELAREQLIEDRIKMSVVDRLDLGLSPDELDAGLREFAARRELEVPEMVSALEAQGIATSTLLDFIEVSISWRNVVQARFRASARPSERDIDIALEFADRTVEEEVLLQELAISIEELGAERANALADRLSRELNRGGNFGGAVAQYSRAASAQRGGNLDWVSARQLPPPVARQVLALQPGEVTAAIPIGAGISIFKLRGIRELPRPPETTGPDTVTFFELIQPLSSAAPERARRTAMSLARNIKADTRLCRDLEPRAVEFGAASGRSEPTPIRALPAGLAGQLSDMEPGDIEIFEDRRGVVLLMLCARSDELSPEEREAVRARLFTQKMNIFAEAFLEELRGDAVILEP
ncbi:peptidylprolyl isomerase [Oceanibium sediminis]|uniref:peptidylprolyl isomerase n=1 Tax=Oceanibium sediminis TaxID=2026339 RepID=UPI0013009789|nr:peptidylprolyl isomerase [Oceanibium sediminis]